MWSLMDAGSTEAAIDALRDLSPSERLLGLYRYGLDGCANRNREQVIAALEELVDTLNFDQGEIAEGFHRLYSVCLDKSRQGRLDEAAWILRELHGLWLDAFDDSLAAPEIPLVPAEVARRGRAQHFADRWR
jgi:hypothetical protein